MTFSAYLVTTLVGFTMKVIQNSQPLFEYIKRIRHAVTFLNLFGDIKEENCPFMLIHSFRKLLLATSWKVCWVKLMLTKY